MTYGKAFTPNNVLDQIALLSFYCSQTTLFVRFTDTE